ncbi:MAG: PQQ-binding-like beta-propeller repeat protein [Gemmataceae bacterium]
MTPRRSLVLAAAVAAGVLLYAFAPRAATPAEAAAVDWLFEAARPGAILSTPLPAGGRVYIAATHSTAFRNAGTVYALDAATGKPAWQFDDGGKMQHTFSTPCLAGGRLYVGEGMHANFTCKLYCLDPDTGRKHWDFTAEGHIESGPCVADGRVFFGAGDDGVYCLDAATGARRWRFAGPYHVDSSPAVSGGRVFVGAGVSRALRATAALCLDAADGKVVWRSPTDLPVWGSPAVADGDVFFGVGNGRLLTGPEKPAGGLLCVSAEDGRPRWRYDAGDAVFGRAAVGPEVVYVGSRGGAMHAIDRRTGARRWVRGLGSPVVASPALVGGRLYVASSAGRVCCLDADSGRVSWSFEAAGRPGVEAVVLASPAVAGRIYVGSELRAGAGGMAVLYCLRDGAENLTPPAPSPLRRGGDE